MWLTLSIICACVFAVNNILGRILAVKSDNPRAFAFVYNFWNGLFALTYWLIKPEAIAAIPADIIYLLIIVVVLYGIFNRYEFYAKKHVEISTLTILFRVASLIAFFASIIFWKESLSVWKLAAAALIVSGSCLAVYKNSFAIDRIGLKYAAIAIISLGLGWAMDKKVSGYFPLAFYAFMTCIPPNIFLLPFPWIKIKEILNEVRLANYKIILLAFLNFSGYFLMINAYRYGEASRVVLVVSSSAILTVLAGIILLKERERIAKKIIASILALSGIVLLTI